jgi:hypothetical protein
MNSLKKIIIASTAALAFTGAAVGAAQAQPGRYYERGYDRDYGRGHDRVESQRIDRLSTAYVDSLNWKIDNAARRGRISWDQARDMRNDLNRVKPIAWRYQTGQARPGEINRLERTVDRITDVVRD